MRDTKRPFKTPIVSTSRQREFTRVRRKSLHETIPRAHARARATRALEKQVKDGCVGQGFVSVDDWESGNSVE
jgi:hypothetical protein